MANEQNLKMYKKGEKRARENGKKGGKKYAENCAKRKTIKECIEIFASLQPNDKVVKQLENVGIPKESANYLMAMVVGVSQRAMKGDPKAFKAINEYLEENPKLQMEKEKNDLDMSLKEKEYQLRVRELELREKEFEHRVAIETGEVKEDDKVFIVNDIDEIPKEEKKHRKTK